MATIQDFYERLKCYNKKYYNGQVKEVSTEQAAEFDAYNHDDLQFCSFGDSSNLEISNCVIKTKPERVKDEIKFMKRGFEVNESSCEILDDQHIHWKGDFRSEVAKVTATRDYMFTIKDGQLLIVEPYNQASALRPLVTKYMRLFDGKTTAVSKNEKDFEEFFDQLFHDNVQVLDDDDTTAVKEEQPKTKGNFNDSERKMLQLGTKFTLLEMKVLDEAHYLIKFHIENDQSDELKETINTVQDGKVIKIEPSKALNDHSEMNKKVEGHSTKFSNA